MKNNLLKQILFIILFTVVGLILLQIPFTAIVGSKQNFSFFDFMASSSGGFLGGIWGGLSVLLVKFIDIIIHKKNLDLTTIIRLFPLVFAALYFGTKSKKIAIIPALCIILFILHPEGRKAWFFSLYWLIPIVAIFFKNRLILNSLGSTFTAHAIGSTAFLYAFNLKAAIWIGLIPVVFMERMVMACGIWVFYLVANTVLNNLAKRVNLKELKLNPNCQLALKDLKKCA